MGELIDITERLAYRARVREGARLGLRAQAARPAFGLALPQMAYGAGAARPATAARSTFPATAARSTRAAFFFTLGCPYSYLAAERVERLFGDVDWVPVAAPAAPTQLDPQLRASIERRAAALRLPLVWPERFPASVPGALRVAARAAQAGAGAKFALAAVRLEFCGGFDLEDPEALAEAAAVAGLTLDECLEAASDPSLDIRLRAAARSLAAQGVRRLPAVRVGAQLYAGEQRLPEIAATLRAQKINEDPLAPVG